ncbi:Protein of unknown function DUF4258 [uncultured Caudovirales phage]|uniref:DUF4258 domain-containing protein n=1 Tax=uncultured Caudovirales phage TaxID=2100421 RepID=A0A6J7W7Y7_9CAUD|nr:Protein of unknown function DUF4258 [uncultured Caudovirales phage]
MFNPVTILSEIKRIAADSGNIVLIKHGKQRSRQRQITRPQIEGCIRKGHIEEGPFLNSHGNWQVTMCRQVAGEEIRCVVAVDFPSKILVITTY